MAGLGTLKYTCGNTPYPDTVIVTGGKYPISNWKLSRNFPAMPGKYLTIKQTDKPGSRTPFFGCTVNQPLSNRWPEYSISGSPFVLVSNINGICPVFDNFIFFWHTSQNTCVNAYSLNKILLVKYENKYFLNVEMQSLSISLTNIFFYFVCRKKM